MNAFMEEMAGHCATCQHWEGDYAKTQKMFFDNPVSMDLKNGWADYAPCNKVSSFMDIAIHGDARVEPEFAAGFGCILWEE